MLFTLPDQAMLCIASFLPSGSGWSALRHYDLSGAAGTLSAIHDRMPVVLNEEGALRYCQGEDQLHCASYLQVRPAD